MYHEVIEQVKQIETEKKELLLIQIDYEAENARLTKEIEKEQSKEAVAVVDKDELTTEINSLKVDIEIKSKTILNLQEETISLHSQINTIEMDALDKKEQLEGMLNNLTLFCYLVIL